MTRSHLDPKRINPLNPDEVDAAVREFHRHPGLLQGAPLGGLRTRYHDEEPKGFDVEWDDEEWDFENFSRPDPDVEENLRSVTQRVQYEERYGHLTDEDF